MSYLNLKFFVSLSWWRREHLHSNFNVTDIAMVHCAETSFPEHFLEVSSVIYLSLLTLFPHYQFRTKEYRSTYIKYRQSSHQLWNLQVAEHKIILVPLNILFPNIHMPNNIAAKSRTEPTTAPTTAEVDLLPFFLHGSCPHNFIFVSFPGPLKLFKYHIANEVKSNRQFSILYNSLSNVT